MFVETTEIPSNLYKPTQPFEATVLENTRISGPDSANDVHHVVFSLAGGNLWYLDGQSLGVLPPGEDPTTGKKHKLRLYSIASPSGGDDGVSQTVSLCVKRVLFENEAGETVKGVCSNYIGDLKPGDKVQVTGPVGKSFLLPTQPNANLIMVATGTGIAPFRAFLKTRYERRASETGQTHLFFGAQHNCDFLYQSWLEELTAAQPSFHLHTAFSREQCTETGQRLYVQHLIHKQRQSLFTLLQQPNTVFYMCGLRGMEDGVLQAFEAAAQETGVVWSELFAQLKAEHRWHVEVY